MRYFSTRDFQARLNSLGFDAGIVDGLNGPQTKKALAKAMHAEVTDNPLDIFHGSGLLRVHWHWTAGSYTVTDKTRSHYNDVFDYQGQQYDGGSVPQSQAAYVPGRIGVSHTLNANTGAIGLAVACMAGATEKGEAVDVGKYPITQAAIDGMLERTAKYCRRYDIRVSKWTTLTHAEIQPTLGIRQRGKWDIRVMPDDFTKLLSPEMAGDFLRERLKAKFI